MSFRPKTSTLTSSDHSLVEIAPTGVSAWSGPTISMKHASADELVVRVKVPLASIGLPASTASPAKGGGWSALIMNLRQGYAIASVLSPAEALCLGPTLCPVIQTSSTNFFELIANIDCSLVAILCAGFSKYSVRDFSLHYLPQTTTVDPANFSLCFTDDPNHPLMGMAAYTSASTGATAPNFSLCKNSVNSIVFAAWSTWSKKMPVDTSTVYYTTGQYPRTGATPQPYSTSPPFSTGSDLRLSSFGCLQCFASDKNTADSLAVKGELYYEVEYRFFDFVPIASTASIPFSLDTYREISSLLSESNPFDEARVKKSWEDRKDPLSPTIPLSRYYALTPRAVPLPPPENKLERLLREAPTTRRDGPVNTNWVLGAPARLVRSRMKALPPARERKVAGTARRPTARS